MTSAGPKIIAKDSSLDTLSNAQQQEQDSPRPQRMHTWFNLIPVDEYEKDKPEQVLFLDAFATIERTGNEDKPYRVLFEGTQELVVVVNIGIIFVWYGKNLQKPDRPFPTFYQELYPTKYISSKPTIFEDTHIMDFVENGSDNLHFKVVHLWNHSKLYDHEVHEDTITLKQDTRFNYGSCSTNPFIRLMSKIIPELELTHDYVYHGPGMAVVNAIGKGAPEFHALVSLTPEGRHRTRVYVTMALSPNTFPKVAEKIYQTFFPKSHLCNLLTGVMANYIKNEFDVDAIIWKNRKWLKEPKLVNSEKHLYDVIRWGESFYPEDYEYPEEEFVAEEAKTWQRLSAVGDILKDKVNTFDVAGNDYIAYYDSKNSLHVYDAYCPHQGAHLGYGGTLEDDCVRCPFHGFHFNTDGACIGQNVNNKKRTLDGLDLKAIPFRVEGNTIEVFV